MGAPFLQTTSTGSIYWQADYGPYGGVFQLRAGASAHQPLRLPGQEAEQVSATSGPNGDTARYYNNARWYRPAWARYTQPDPLGLFEDPTNLYGYALMNPETFIDPSGLCGDSNGHPVSDGPPPSDGNNNGKPGCDPAGDPNAPLLPFGDTWSSQYLYGAANYMNIPAFYFAEVGQGVFNYQNLGSIYIDAGNWGLGVYGLAAGFPEWEINIAIARIGAADGLSYGEIRQDELNAELGREWAAIYCHK